MEKPRIGIVGVGRWGSNIARVLWELHREGLISFEIVIDIDIEKAKNIARKYGVKKYSNNLIDAQGLDGVVVAVPIPYLAKTALKLVKQGLNVFVEKPVARSVAEIKELINAVKERNVKAVPGFIMRFNPVIEYLAENIKRIDLNVVELRRLSRRPPSARRNSIILDLAVHDIDIANYLFRDTDAMLIKWYHTRISGDEVVKIILEYDGIPVMIHVDGICPVKVREIDIIAKDYFIRGNTDTNVIVYKTLYEERIVKLSSEEPLKKEIKEWIKLLVEDRSKSPTLEDALRVLELAEPILKATSF